MADSNAARERLARYRQAAAEFEDLATLAVDGATWSALMAMANTRMQLAQDIERELDRRSANEPALRLRH